MMKLSKLFVFSLVIWCSVLVLTGTYLRGREENSMPDSDWLIMVQLMACLLAGFLGILLIAQNPQLGASAQLLLLFVFSAALSGIFAMSFKILFGYWVLLCGISLLTIGIIQQADSEKTLQLIEAAWFITLTVILFKDVTQSFLLGDIQTSGDEPARLGSAVTHSNQLGLYAVLCFWLSFRQNNPRMRFLLNVLRAAFILILLLTKSRTSMLGFIAGAIIFVLMQSGFKYRKGTHLQFVILFFAASIFFFLILSLVTNAPWAGELFTDFNRGQSATDIMSMTGRTAIWRFAFFKMHENPYSYLLGYGYNMSRFVINDGFNPLLFYVPHLHNAFIEVFFSMGSFGLIILLLLFFRSITWLFKPFELSEAFSSGFVIRAAVFAVIILLNSITECLVVKKVNPVMILFFFYIVALDRQHAILEQQADLPKAIPGL